MPKLAQILEQSSGTRQAFVSLFFLFWSLYKTNRFHVAVGVFSNWSQRTSKCGKNVSDTLACVSCATLLFLPHFDVTCDLQGGTRQAFVSLFFLFWSLYKTNRFHVAVGVFSNWSQRTSKCGKNVSDTLACVSCATSLFLPHFDVTCDLLLNRGTATWNVFVK